MRSLWLWVAMLGVSTAQAGSMIQQTEGWCSPAVGHTEGNVTIICHGVAPQALDALNRELGLTHGQLRLTNQQLEQKTEANEWARKYHELFKGADLIQDNNITPQTKDLLREGKLKEADTLLRRSTISRAQYQVLQDGMSYQEVVQILGRPGVESGRAGNYVDYLWYNPDGSALAAGFVDGRMTVKNPAMLR
jgi:hypothetical protein